MLPVRACQGDLQAHIFPGKHSVIKNHFTWLLFKMPVQVASVGKKFLISGHVELDV